MEYRSFKPQTEISERTDGCEGSSQHEPPSISRQNEGRQCERQKDKYEGETCSRHFHSISVWIRVLKQENR
jgi:hypothetical protein